MFAVSRPTIPWSQLAPRLPIMLVGLLAVYVTVKSCTHWWKSERRASLAATQTGEGMIVRGDGLGYYAWLRSALIDGDLSCDNEFDEHNIYRDGLPPVQSRTPTGMRLNVQSVGPACVWAPAVLVAHGVVTSWPGGAPWPADGYSLPYQAAVGATSLAMSLLGFYFLNAICCLYARPGVAAWAACFLALGTTIFYYGAYEITMAHGMGVTTLAAFVYYWLKTYGSTSLLRWMGVGALLGVACLMRWQLTLFALLPVGECVYFAWQSIRERSFDRLWRVVLGLALAGLGTCIALMPQFIVWRLVYGTWVAIPHTMANRWLDPSLGQVLISQDRSLFYWTPITLVGVLGLGYYCLRRDPDAQSYQRWPLFLMGFTLALQIYFVACAYGTGVYLGASYGFRLLTESLVVLAPGITLLMASARLWQACTVGVVCCALALWNCSNMVQYRRGMLPSQAGASYSTMVHNVPKLFKK